MHMSYSVTVTDQTWCLKRCFHCHKLLFSIPLFTCLYKMHTSDFIISSGCAPQFVIVIDYSCTLIRWKATAVTTWDGGDVEDCSLGHSPLLCLHGNGNLFLICEPRKSSNNLLAFVYCIYVHCNSGSAYYYRQVNRLESYVTRACVY